MRGAGKRLFFETKKGLAHKQKKRGGKKHVEKTDIHESKEKDAGTHPRMENRTHVGNEPWMCSKICFTKME